MLHSVLSFAECDTRKKGSHKAKPAWAAAIEQAIGPAGFLVVRCLLRIRHDD